MPKTANIQGTDGRSVTEGLPSRYELIDANGYPVHHAFETAQEAAELAKHLWPDQEQDEDRTGKGWDVQVVGS